MVNVCKCNKESEISEIHTLVKDMHRSLFGNGRPGLLAEFNQAKGAITLLKWVVGSSCTVLVAVIGYLIQIHL